MSDIEIENEIQAKGLNAPRLTPADIEATIKGETYHVFPGTTLTVCCLILQNDFAITGESAAVSPENFDAELGRKIARENAKDKIWLLEGYLLKDLIARPHVRISGEEYEQLFNDAMKLAALEAAGVDNWEGYGDAIASLSNNEDNEEDA